VQGNCERDEGAGYQIAPSSVCSIGGAAVGAAVELAARSV